MKALSTLAAALLLLSSAARSEPLPRWEELAEQDDTRMVEQVRALVVNGPDLERAIVALDAMLAKVSKPTPLRGMIQFFRAQGLQALNRDEEAIAAAEESARLLRGYSLPSMTAAELAIYSDRPERAVDPLLAATGIDPQVVELLPDYDAASLIARLREEGHDEKLIVLSERLIALQWPNGSSATRSRLAMAVIEGKMLRADVQGAAALVPHVALPSDFQRILIEARFAPLRDAAEGWAGARIEKQWPIYLREERNRWQDSADLEDGVVYARALMAARHDRTLVNTFKPVLDDEPDAPEVVFLAPIVAEAMARLGRWDEADAVLANAEKAFPLGSHANALNIAAGRGRLLVIRGHAADGLQQIEAAIKDASQRGGEVNGRAIAARHAHRVCALTQLGRGETGSSMKITADRSMLNVGDHVQAMLCMDDVAGARDTLANGLGHDTARLQVIRWMQPDSAGFDSEVAHTLKVKSDALKRDEVLLAAVARHGSVLDWPVNVGSPPE